MPRDITVTFSDGSTHVYRGAPDDITPEAVTQRAQKEFSGMSVKSLDGGRNSSTPSAPAAKTAVGRPAPKKDALLPADAKRIWDENSARLEAKIAGLPENIKQRARDQFFNAPAIKRLQVASAQPAKVPTARERGRAKAKKAQETGIAPYLPGRDFLGAVGAGVSRSLFGLPERAAAALKAPFSDKDYGEILEEMRGATDYEREQSTAGNIIGTLYGSVAGGSLAGAAVRNVGGRLAASSAPKVVQAAGKALRGAATVQQGQRVRNAAKFVAAGTAGGAAQAAGEGSDVETGAIAGAVGGAVIPVLGKGLGFVRRRAADILGMTKADTALRRLTSATREELEAAAQKFRDETGAEPTLYEVLPLKDRNRLAKEVVGRTEGTQERTAAAVRQRISNVGPELSSNLARATRPGRQQINEQMASDLAEAAGGRSANRGILPGGPGADRSPVDMEAFRGAEARARMEPIDDTRAAEQLEDFFPRSLSRNEQTGEVSEVFSDPEMNSLLSRVAGTMRLRRPTSDETADVTGLSVRDVSGLIERLEKIPPASADYLTAQRTAAHLLDRLSPEARETTEAMRSAYAGRSRMMEGMAEGGRTRTREAVPVGDRAAAQEATNAYDSPEGAAGRFLGQSNKLSRDFSGTNSDVLRTAGNIAESGQTQAALRGNLGDEAAGRVTAAARAQSQSIRNLGSLSKEKSDVADSVGVEDIGKIILALNPQSMPATKLFALSRIATLTRLPERKANQIVDMMFSQNPAVTNKAIAALNSAGTQGKTAMQAIARALATGSISEQVVNSGENLEPLPVPNAEAAPMPENLLPEEMAAEPDDGVQEFGSYQEMLNDTMANEDPELVALWHRQTGQESNRQQFDQNGNPLTSSAGAIGLAQVMPGTAPEAAALAGLEYDDFAYKNDPAYNELIGFAYMKEMLRRFNGDPELALAAYNAGPGAVERAGGVPQIAETQDYVDRILMGG